MKKLIAFIKKCVIAKISTFKVINFREKIRRDYFSSTLDSFITVFFIAFILILSKSIISWILFTADWNVVTNNINEYVFGLYPSNEIWRPKLWLFLLFILTISTIIGNKRYFSKNLLKISWLLQLPLGILLLSGAFGLNAVEARNWGGITLTLILTISSGLLSLPLGIFLALARQSNFKLLRKISSAYIDIMRSFPLITVLFFGQLLIPLFLPMDLEVNRVLRAILAFSLFTAAYIAEDIRGGLQSIPRTQKEAAAVLGLSSKQTTQIIVLPQALKIALPSLTNQFIGLLQNTSLMAILGLVEFMGIGRSILANPQFIGRYLEVYIWLALIYWLLCTAIAMISRKLEKDLKAI